MSRSAPTLAAGVFCLGLIGCALAGGGRPPSTYDLVAPRSFAAAPRPAAWQLAVYEPTAVHALETNRLMVRPQADQVSYYKGVAWSDRLPRLVQARIIQTFQNSGAVKAVSASTVSMLSRRSARLPDRCDGAARPRRDRDLREAGQCRLGQGDQAKGFSARVPA
jgi:cholesterol transport system auxiliary component